MEKQLFIKAIEALQKQYEKDSHFADTLSSLFPESYSASLLPDNHLLTNVIVEILQKTFNDDQANSWIEHFCFELNFGQENWRLKVTDKNGENIPLTTSEDLYNLLINEIKTSHL